MSKYSFRNHSEENIQALGKELSNGLNILNIFEEVNTNETFNILNSIIVEENYKSCQIKIKTMATQKLSKP